MKRDLTTPNTTVAAGFARAALTRAQAILDRMEAGGDTHTIAKWRRVVSSLEMEAAREIVAEMRGAA